MIKTSILVSATAGSIATLLFEPKISFWRAILLVFSGAGAAVFTCPMVVHYLKIEEHLSHAVTFLLGLLSMKLVGVIMIILDKIKEDPSIILNYVRRYFNSNK